MIKFEISSKIWEGERCKFWKVLGKCQNYRFFDIFLGILHKMKWNLSQECVKRGFYPIRAKLEQLPLIFLEK